MSDQTYNDRIRAQYEAYMALRQFRQDPGEFDFIPRELKVKRHNKDKRGKRHE